MCTLDSKFVSWVFIDSFCPLRVSQAERDAKLVPSFGVITDTSSNRQEGVEQSS